MIDWEKRRKEIQDSIIKYFDLDIYTTLQVEFKNKLIAQEQSMIEQEKAEAVKGLTEKLGKELDIKYANDERTWIQICNAINKVINKILKK